QIENTLYIHAIAYMLPLFSSICTMNLHKSCWRGTKSLDQNPVYSFRSSELFYKFQSLLVTLFRFPFYQYNERVPRELVYRLDFVLLFHLHLINLSCLW